MKLKFLYIFILLFFNLHCDWVYSQEKSSWSKSKVNKAASKLSESLDENASEERIAGEYDALAKELSDKGEYAKAEEYLKRSKQIYSKQNKKDKLYVANREFSTIKILDFRVPLIEMVVEIAAAIGANKQSRKHILFPVAR